MADDKRFRFSADETVSNTINKLRRESEELGRGLIRDARAYTTSAKETLSYIENQIKAIERRNKVDQKSQMIQAETQRQTGELTEGQFKTRKAQIGLESKADEQQVILLRELIETIKQESKREIIEDRKGVNKKIRSDKRIDELSPTGDAFEILKSTIQRQELGDIKEQEREEKDRFEGIRRAGEMVNRTGGMVAGSSNEFFMAASVMAAIPIVGDALSALGQRAFGAAQQMQTNRGRLYGVTGGGPEAGKFGAIGLTGATFAEFYELQKQTAISMGRGSGAGEAASNIMLLERLGVDRNLLLGQERLGMGGARGSRASMEDLVKYMQSSGAIKGQDFSLLGEYFDLSLQLQREQLRVSGETNDNISSKLIAGISSIDESFKNPDVLRGLIPSITGALSRPTTPQAEAFQYGILRRISPGASLSQLQEMREAPTLEYFNKVLGDVKRLFPEEEIGVQVLKGMFGLEGQTKLARKLFRGDVDISNYQNQQGIINLRSRVGRTTGELESASSKWDRRFETYGDDLSKLIKEIIGKDSVIGKAAEGFKEGSKDFTEAVDKWVKSKWWVPNIVSPKEQAKTVNKWVYGNK